jgi:UDP-hydrolysing UDP-N-acetyl-D-glucosamine 2-epimerase
MRTIGVVTSSRADYGIYFPVLCEINKDPDLTLQLMVTGMHLSPEFGLTVRSIEEDGFTVGERIVSQLSSDTPEAIAKSVGLGTIGFAQVYARSRPDVLLVLGDRFDMLTSVMAALPFKLPIAHIHGGELTEGAIDDAIRHAITKMSHLHFVATEEYARRIIDMGEEPWRVTISGAPALDNVRSMTVQSLESVNAHHGMNVQKPFLLVTYHPATLEYESTLAHIRELLAALSEVDFDLVITYPNADTASDVVIRTIHEFVHEHSRRYLLKNLGTAGYLSLMRQASGMVGNSSSGIIEAASFQLPVVNIGNRQRGRLRPRNVIDTGNSREEILRSIQRALTPEFKSSLTELINPYGDGHAAERIVSVLKSAELGSGLLMKKFYQSSRAYS